MLRVVRARHAVVVAIALGAVGFVLAPGCQDATQATLEIRMLKSELCAKHGGTAIAVGVDRVETETRIATFVTAETRDCDVTSGTIGSLVVTPGDSGRAAIVVAVAFDTTRARNASECKPPAYAGCIVARRFLGFSNHKNLRLPITIDPDCLDVPCNAVSTCRKGNCYDSTTINGEEPGDDGNGGALEGGIVDGSADGFTPDGSKNDGGGDAASDGDAGDGAVVFDGGDSGSAPPASCNAGTLYCNHSTKSTPEPCARTNGFECCDTDKVAQCGGANSCAGQLRYCCSDNDCNSPVEVCKSYSATVPGRCLPPAAEEATCPDGPGSPVRCPSAPCGGGIACCNTPPTCQMGSTCQGGKLAARWCCNDADCAGEIPAVPCGPRVGGAAGTCLKGMVDSK